MRSSSGFGIFFPKTWHLPKSFLSMPLRLNRTGRFIIGLTAVALLYTFYSLYISNEHFVEATSRGVRHVIRFSTILLAYGIGLFGFGRYYPGWLIQLWHILYIGLLAVLLLSGFYDTLVAELPPAFRNLNI